MRENYMFPLKRRENDNPKRNKLFIVNTQPTDDKVHQFYQHMSNVTTKKYDSRTKLPGGA